MRGALPPCVHIYIDIELVRMPSYYNERVSHSARAPRFPHVWPLLVGVDFDVIAREWRMKWTSDSDKQSLVQALAALVSVLATVRVVGFNSSHTASIIYKHVARVGGGR
jgi:hypothetical protein